MGQWVAHERLYGVLDATTPVRAAAVADAQAFRTGTAPVSAAVAQEAVAGGGLVAPSPGPGRGVPLMTAWTWVSGHRASALSVLWGQDGSPSLAPYRRAGGAEDRAWACYVAVREVGAGYSAAIAVMSSSFG